MNKLKLNRVIEQELIESEARNVKGGSTTNCILCDLGDDQILDAGSNNKWALKKDPGSLL